MHAGMAEKAPERGGVMLNNEDTLRGEISLTEPEAAPAPVVEPPANRPRKYFGYPHGETKGLRIRWSAQAHYLLNNDTKLLEKRMKPEDFEALMKETSGEFEPEPFEQQELPRADQELVVGELGSRPVQAAVENRRGSIWPAGWWIRRTRSRRGSS